MDVGVGVGVEYKESREEVNLLGEKSLDNGVYERVSGKE